MESMWAFFLSADFCPSVNQNSMAVDLFCKALCALRMERSAAELWDGMGCDTTHGSICTVAHRDTEINLHNCLVSWGNCSSQVCVRVWLTCDWRVASSNPLAILEKCGDGKWIRNMLAYLSNYCVGVCQQVSPRQLHCIQTLFSSSAYVSSSCGKPAKYRPMELTMWLHIQIYPAAT